MKKRKIFIAANWKMNTSSEEAKQLINGIKKESNFFNNIDVALIPPFPYIFLMKELLSGSNIKYGGQNMYWEKKGAFTGEVSPLMLKDLGCIYVILGHSERRKYFGETDDVINKKIKSALQNNLLPIFCLGETQEERDNNRAFKVVEKQLIQGLAGIESDGVKRITIAYEPVWAIGTGKNATPEQADEMHCFLRRILEREFTSELSQTVRIQYGGSVTTENIGEIIQKEDIDGALIGGASLKIESFVAILKTADKI